MMPRKLVAVSIAIILLLTGCSSPVQHTAPAPTAAATHGIYEFTFEVVQTAGAPTDQWEFCYTYSGETIRSGHRILYSLELFTFYRIQVTVTERGVPDNAYCATFPVAICNGASGKAEISVTGANGNQATFQITCRVTQIGRQ